MATSDAHASRFRAALRSAWNVRASLHASSSTTAYRIIDGRGDSLAGVYLDRYGPGVVLGVHDDARLTEEEVSIAANLTLDELAAHGIESVYVKRFARDRSRLGGRAPEESRTPTPRAGRLQPEALTVREHGAQFEVRLYDGFSTGLFLEQREHRRFLATLGAARALNLFAYTCGFGVPLAAAGATVVNVDVSSRYLTWGRRNLALNEVSGDRTRFHRMDALEFLAYAARRGDRFDLIVLDPPTFAAGGGRRSRGAWKAVSGYPRLVRAAAGVLARGGLIFASTNTRELASPSELAAMIEAALGRQPLWKQLPPWPTDVRERGRVAAALFEPR
jgi:23S rRNA (cytosine1962-C5)-methyltransferase